MMKDKKRGSARQNLTPDEILDNAYDPFVYEH